MSGRRDGPASLPGRVAGRILRVVAVLSAVEHRLMLMTDVAHDAKMRFAEIIAAVRSEVMDEDQCVERALYGAQGQ